MRRRLVRLHGLLLADQRFMPNHHRTTNAEQEERDLRVRGPRTKPDRKRTRMISDVTDDHDMAELYFDDLKFMEGPDA